MSVDYTRRLFGLEGQTAVVIGGSGVLGGAICEGLGRVGAQLVIAGRSASRGHKRVEVVRALAGTAGFRRVDVLERDSIQSLLDYVLGEYGVVDILVNSVHGRMEAEEDETNDQAWRGAVDVHTRGTYWACQTFAAQMAKQSQGGAILNVACGVACGGGRPLMSNTGLSNDREPSYPNRTSEERSSEGSAKWEQVGKNAARRQVLRERRDLLGAGRSAMLQLTRRAALQWSSHGVRINALCVDGFLPGASTSASRHNLTAAELPSELPLAHASPPSSETTFPVGSDEPQPLMNDNRPVDEATFAAGERGPLPSLGRWGVPEDVVGAALLLVSRRAGGFITGAELRVDGGIAVESG